MFTAEQLTNSLHATYLQAPVLRASALMDIKHLHSDILLALPSDLIAQTHLSDTTNPRWLTNDAGFCYNRFPPVITGVRRELREGLWTKSEV